MLEKLLVNTIEAGVESGDEIPKVVQRSHMTTKKHLCIVFWDHSGLLLIDTLQRNENINAERYCESLDKLADALRVKRRRHVAHGFNNFQIFTR